MHGRKDGAPLTYIWRFCHAPFVHPYRLCPPTVFDSRFLQYQQDHLSTNSDQSEFRNFFIIFHQTLGMCPHFHLAWSSPCSFLPPNWKKNHGRHGFDFFSVLASLSCTITLMHHMLCSLWSNELQYSDLSKGLNKGYHIAK